MGFKPGRGGEGEVPPGVGFAFGRGELEDAQDEGQVEGHVDGGGGVGEDYRRAGEFGSVGDAAGDVDGVGFGAPVPGHFDGLEFGAGRGEGVGVVGVGKVEDVGVDEVDVGEGLVLDGGEGQRGGEVEGEEEVEGEDGGDGEVLARGEGGGPGEVGGEVGHVGPLAGWELGGAQEGGDVGHVAADAEGDDVREEAVAGAAEDGVGRDGLRGRGVSAGRDVLLHVEDAVVVVVGAVHEEAVRVEDGDARDGDVSVGG